MINSQQKAKYENSLAWWGSDNAERLRQRTSSKQGRKFIVKWGGGTKYIHALHN